jgi:exodeoxyribonuclease VII small subunit
MPNLKFEDALKRLEEIVRDLEKGDLMLDDALKMYEEGIRLSRKSLDMLDNAEKKIEILMQEKNGTKRARPFDMEPETGEAGEE